MSWYSKYLEYFEKPFTSVPKSAIEEVRNNLKCFKTSDAPVASIVIIANNEETRLFSCLWSLSENCCNFPVEFIGIDNDSTDQTANIYDAVGIKWYTEKQRSPGYARRCGLQHARGKYYFCIDSDTLYPPNYITTYVNFLEKQGVVGVTGLWSFVPGEKYSKLNLKIYEFFRNIHIRLLFHKRPELAVRGMVFAFRTEYGRVVGFRTDIKRGEDGSLSLGLMKFGKMKLITGKKTRAVTATSTLGIDGSFFKSFTKRIKSAFSTFSVYFTKKTHYEDKDANLTDAFKKNKN